MAKQKKTERWRMYRGSCISTTAIVPGIWARKEGGFVVRGKALEETTGIEKNIWKVLPNADLQSALKWRQEELVRVRAGVTSLEQPKMRFAEFARLLFEQKLKLRKIISATGRRKWRDVLVHLIEGTKVTDDKGNVIRHVRGFGEFYIDKLHSSHVEQWKLEMADLIADGHYAPTTVNGWLQILRNILKAAKRAFSLPVIVTEGIDNFDTSEHVTYTEEEPNALLPEEVAPFMAKFRELHPAHYAMVFVGMATGLRPSSLRPLRRRGLEADVLWEKNRILVRRSQTIGDEVMKTTKQKKRYSIALPDDVMKVLRWHVETQLTTDEQQDSELLFPSTTGGFRSPSVLNKPLAEVARELGLGKKISQRALRRTYNDLARAAGVSDFITRSISGHQTEAMQVHYSTANDREQEQAVSNIIQLFETGRSGRGDHKVAGNAG